MGMRRKMADDGIGIFDLHFSPNLPKRFMGYDKRGVELYIRRQEAIMTKVRLEKEQLERQVIRLRQQLASTKDQLAEARTEADAAKAEAAIAKADRQKEATETSENGGGSTTTDAGTDEDVLEATDDVMAEVPASGDADDTAVGAGAEEPDSAADSDDEDSGDTDTDGERTDEARTDDEARVDEGAEDEPAVGSVADVDDTDDDASGAGAASDAEEVGEVKARA